MIGQRLAERYQIESVIGQGGMGIVYRAYDQQAEQPVAVKILHPHLTSGTTPTRFYREFRVLTRLDHPHIVQALDYGAQQQIPYLILEYLEGETLAERLTRQGPFTREQLLHLAGQICEALRYLHQRSIVHRDLKPSNLMLLTEAGRTSVQLMDFGLVRLTNLSTHLTEEGSTLGTLAYIAPEQAQGLPVDFRADLYALGIVLYEMATGRPPFMADNVASLLLQQISSTPRSPRHFRPDLDEPLTEFILSLLLKEPANRPARTELVAEQIASLADTTLPELSDSINPVDMIPRVPLIGRESSSERLRVAWEQARGGQGQLLLVAGAAGIGKSRLLTEFRPTVRLSNGRFLSATCREQLALPYQPLTDILDALVDRLPASTRRRLPAELKRILPSGQDDTVAEPGGAGDEGQARLRLFDGCWQILQAGAERRPLCLVIEDIQWADPTVMELVSYLVSKGGQQPILFILTYRPEESDPRRESIQALQREPFSHTVELPPLTEAQMKQFLQLALAWPEVPNWLVESVYRATDGNPFFIEETLKTLAIEGQVERWKRENLVGLTTTILPGTQLQLPATVLELAERRLQILSPTDRSILTTAAIIGSEFSFRLLQDMSDEPEEQLLDVIDRLLVARFIEELPWRGGEDRYRFAQESFRQALLKTVSHRRRRLLHQRAGAALQQLYGTERARYWPALAHHFVASGQWELALPYLLRAGNKALAVYAYAEAVGYYSQALQLIDEAEDESLLSGEAWLQLYRQRGRCLELMNEYESALANYRQMAELAERRADADLKLASLMGRVVIYATPTPVHDIAQGQELAEQAVELARQLADMAAEAKALWALQLTAQYGGQWSEAIHYGEQSLALARQCDLREQLAYTLNDLFVAYRYIGAGEKAVQVLEESQLLWRELDNKPMLVDNLGNAAGFYYAAGDFARVLNLTEEIMAVSEESDNLWGKAYGRWTAGYTYQEYGQLDKALQMMAETIQLSQAGGLSWPQVTIGCDRAWLLAQLGDLAGALTLAHEVKALAEEITPGYLPYVYSTLVRLYIAREELEQAAELLEDGSIWQAVNPFSAQYRRPRVEFYLASGEYERAIAVAEEAIEQSRSAGWMVRLPELFLLQGRAWWEQGEPEQAERAFSAGQSLAEQFQARWRLWPILAARSRLYASQSRDEEAASVREQGAEVIVYLERHLSDPILRQLFSGLEPVRYLRA